MTPDEVLERCRVVAERFRDEHYGEAWDAVLHLLVAEMVAEVLSAYDPARCPVCGSPPGRSRP